MSRKYVCTDCGAPVRYRATELREGRKVVGKGLGTWRATCGHKNANGKARVRVVEREAA